MIESKKPGKRQIAVQNRHQFRIPSLGGVAKGRGGFLRLILAGLMFCSLILCGCSNGTDATDEENPLVRKGLEQVHLKNWDKAVELFRKALNKDPELARPDLELALIYHQYKDNFVYAIYHYEQYLDKRPETEKKPLIRDWIRQAKISLAGEIGRTAGDISGELVRLRRENNLLRQQLEAFSDKSIPAPKVASVKTLVDDPPEILQPDPEPVIETPEPTPVSPQPVQRIQTPKPEIRTYKVLPGDTLMRIARSVYGDGTKWRRIYEANLDSMENENDLKVGQIIRIPPLDNSPSG